MKYKQYTSFHSSLAQPIQCTNTFSNLEASGPPDRQSQNVMLEKGHGSRDESHPPPGVKPGDRNMAEEEKVLGGSSQDEVSG